MGAYLNVCKGGAYSKNQCFIFFTAVFTTEYTGNKCLYKFI